MSVRGCDGGRHIRARKVASECAVLLGGNHGAERNLSSRPCTEAGAEDGGIVRVRRGRTLAIRVTASAGEDSPSSFYSQRAGCSLSTSASKASRGLSSAWWIGWRR